MTTMSNSQTETLPASSSEQVAEVLRDQIIRGDIPQGIPLRELTLSSTMGVSRRTIREALMLLASQGLIDHERNRGATVRTLHSADVVDLYTIRRALETQGARSAPQAHESDREYLTQAFERLRESAQRGDSYTIVKADLAFHGAVIGLIGSPRINSFYGQISAEMEMAISLIRKDEDAVSTSPEQVIAEHARIHDHLQARDSLEAQQAIIEHANMNERRLLEVIAKSDMRTF